MRWVEKARQTEIHVINRGGKIVGSNAVIGIRCEFETVLTNLFGSSKEFVHT